MEESLTWEAREFEYKHKSADWYWILGIIVVAGMLLSILTGNILFGILIGVGGFVFSMYASKHPDTLSCEINKRGTRVNDEFYPHSSVETFWVHDMHKGIPKLFLTLKHRFSMQVAIPIEGIASDHVRDYLLNFIHEEEQPESFVERIMELIHF